MLRQFSKSLTSFGIALGVLVALGATALPCHAAMINLTPNPGQVNSSGTVLMSDLLSGEVMGITVGDKEFTGFAYGRTNDMPPATAVNVLGLKDTSGNWGITFQGAFGDTPGNGGSDAFIRYQVEVTDPLFLIYDVHLAGNPNVLGENDGTMSITESFVPLPSPQLEIFDDFGNEKFIDWANLMAPVKILHVQKDIHSIAITSSSTLSFIDQSFSQIQIPEPATVLMSVIGMVALAGYLRRRD